MTLYHYKIKNYEEQCALIFSQGELLCSKIENERTIKLFALGDFFIELHYDDKSVEIIEKKEFRCGHLLDEYSQDVKAIFDFK